MIAREHANSAWHRGVRPLLGVLVAALASCSAPAATPGALPDLTTATQTIRFAAWQQALERNAGGQTAIWSDGEGASGSIAPIDTVYSATDGWCRTYEEAITGRVTYRVVGIACRKAGPRWLALDVRAIPDGAATPSH